MCTSLQYKTDKESCCGALPDGEGEFYYPNMQSLGAHQKCWREEDWSIRSKRRQGTFLCYQVVYKRTVSIFHDHWSNWEFIWRISTPIYIMPFSYIYMDMYPMQLFAWIVQPCTYLHNTFFWEMILCNGCNIHINMFTVCVSSFSFFGLVIVVWSMQPFMPSYL